MERSELKEVIRETILTEIEGYSKYYPGGKTPGLTKNVMDTILMNIAKGTNKPEEDEIIGYSYERHPDTPEDQHSLRTRIYHNKKTGKNYIKQIGDGEEDKIFRNEK